MEVAQALSRVNQQISTIALRLGRVAPRLVAVSKLKPVSDIQQAYDCGHRAFGENYAQELAEKAPQLPSDIQWHFIGHLQSNKAKLIAGIPNLWVVESVDSAKLATALNNACEKANRELRVFVQINTSGEACSFCRLNHPVISPKIDTQRSLDVHLKRRIPSVPTSWKNARVCCCVD